MVVLYLARSRRPTRVLMGSVWAKPGMEQATFKQLTTTANLNARIFFLGCISIEKYPTIPVIHLTASNPRRRSHRVGRVESLHPFRTTFGRQFVCVASIVT